MRKAQPVIALVLLLVMGCICSLPGGAPPVPSANTPEQPGSVPETARPESVGTINLVNSQVQTGRPENLQSLTGPQDFHNGDGVRVTDGGKGKLTLNDGTLLTLFNQAQVPGVQISVSPRETRIQLDNEGFQGKVPSGGRTVVDMPNGAQIIVLGTNFFIKYNTGMQIATAGNYDGTVHFIPPGGTEQELPPGRMVHIPPPGQEPFYFMELPFKPEEFEAAVDKFGTPTAALDDLIQEYKLEPLRPPAGQTVPVTEPPVVAQTGWSAWQQLDGQFQDSPAVASWGVNRLDVFVRGMENALWHKAWTGDAWSGWENLGGGLSSSPAATSWGENRIDIFVLDPNRQVSEFVWDNAWFGWYPQGGGDVESGGLLEDAPAVSSGSPNRLDLFVRNSGHGIRYKYWDGSAWSEWTALGGLPIYSSPSVVSTDGKMFNLVARGESSQVLWRNAVGDWEELGQSIQDAPALASWGPDRMDVFARGMDNSLLHSTWTPSTSWSDWENLGGPIYSSPAAVSWGPGRIDVFARGEAGNLMQISYQE